MRPSLRRLTLSISLFASAAMAVPASADDFIFAPSIVVDFSFGDRWDVGLGLDLRVTALLNPDRCSGDGDRHGMGAYARGMWLLRGGAPRVAAGLHGGFQGHEDTVGWDFEAGWMWQGAVETNAGGHGFQLGVLATAGVVDLAGRFSAFDGGDAWYPAGHLAVGARYITPMGIEPGPGVGCPIRSL